MLCATVHTIINNNITAVLGNLATANCQAITGNHRLGMCTNKFNTNFVLPTRACADMHVMDVARFPKTAVVAGVMLVMLLFSQTTNKYRTT